LKGGENVFAKDSKASARKEKGDKLAEVVKQSKPNEKKVIYVQSVWRGYKARKEYKPKLI
jgi:hypothetical protein